MSDGADSRPPTVPEGIPELDEATPVPQGERPELLIISGMSGAGRSRAAAALEDLSWYVVDNLPPRLLGALAGMLTPGAGVRRLAAVVDVRSGAFFSELVAVLEELRQSGVDYRIMFLDADDAELVRRYESVRRPHPLQGDGRLLEGITAERTMLRDLRGRADVLIDTTSLSVHDLARRVREEVGTSILRQVRLSIMSFGFKHGLPLDADHVVDVRFLANPYWVSELRHLTGKDSRVSEYVLGQPDAETFVESYVDTLNPVISRYLDELKPFVTIGVGCTGGKHRSVAITERMAELFRERGQQVRTIHRDVGRD
ncbi:Hypothetical ATP-binding protein UPF0042, contains P-loop [Actinomycetales bacterium JB111]|nr:Hypothetical ATP-binding protein UPF0042, contains P-loop [Actinomycetales bacterium JB111]